jgi:hypothetical protein
MDALAMKSRSSRYDAPLGRSRKRHHVIVKAKFQWMLYRGDGRLVSANVK